MGEETREGFLENTTPEVTETLSKCGNSFVYLTGDHFFLNDVYGHCHVFIYKYRTRDSGCIRVKNISDLGPDTVTFN